MANSKRISKKEASARPTKGAVAYLSPCVVGIGASAGGFEAIRNFFLNMPLDSGVAFVVVQHMDPSHISLAAELFAKCTTMPVSEAKDDELLEANHVYTSPSDKEVSVRDGRLRLAPRHSHVHLQLPIDHFFNSLGNDLGVRAIGIVLSGTGSDGTLGLKTIATQGGIVLVQDPATAQFDGMPLSAIGARIANYVLPVEKMPAVIAGYAKHPYADGISENTDVDGDPKIIRAFVKILLERRGYDFSGYKIGTLQRRIPVA
jgi:two-component system, chemotaxis family, CheB/CheR fusion protein